MIRIKKIPINLEMNEENIRNYLFAVIVPVIGLTVCPKDLLDKETVEVTVPLNLPKSFYEKFELAIDRFLKSALESGLPEAKSAFHLKQMILQHCIEFGFGKMMKIFLENNPVAEFIQKEIDQARKDFKNERNNH